LSKRQLKIKNKMRKVCLLTFLIISSSCGFHPLYESDNKMSDKSYGYNKELASIKIEVTRKKLNQDLKNNLEQVLNPDGIKVDQKYSLNLSLEKSLFSTFTTANGSSGRYRVVLDAKYTLRNLKSGEVIAEGTTTTKDAFDVESKRFANYIVEDVIASNLTLIIAQNIRNLLTNDIINDYKLKNAKATNLPIKYPLEP